MKFATVNLLKHKVMKLNSVYLFSEFAFIIKATEWMISGDLSEFITVSERQLHNSSHMDVITDVALKLAQS